MNIVPRLLLQILTYMPKYQLDKIIEKYKWNYKAQELSCWEQHVYLVFAQLAYRESLRDIESCLEAFEYIRYNPSYSYYNRSTIYLDNVIK